MSPNIQNFLQRSYPADFVLECDIGVDAKIGVDVRLEGGSSSTIKIESKYRNLPEACVQRISDTYCLKMKYHLRGDLER